MFNLKESSSCCLYNFDCYILYVFTVEADYINEQMNTLYKIIHTVNFNTSIQALMLIYQVMDARSETGLHFVHIIC